ncbi:MAG: PAS domain S-box protein [Nitrospirota bacterium]
MPIRILHLEDEDLDARLVSTKLKADIKDCEIVRARGKEDFEELLGKEKFDVFLIDFALPGYDGMAALKAVRRLDPIVPFIILSGTIGEARAIETLKLGATDFALKDELARLASIIRRALKEAAEKAELAEQHEMFRNLSEESIAGIYIIREGRYTYANRAFAEIFGYTREEIMSMDYLDLIHPDFKDHVRENIRKRLDGEVKSIHYQVKAIKKNGNVIDVEKTGTHTLLKGGPAIIGTCLDITEKTKAEEERKRTEEQIRLQNEWLSVTLKSIGDAVIATDREGNVTFMNAVAERATGWKSSEAEGQPLGKVFNIINELTREPAENPVTRVLSEGRVVGLANHTALISKTGDEIIIEDSAAPIRDANDSVIGVILVFHDVTEKHRVQEEAVHTQKLESLRVLAGGIAHDLNNLMVAVLGNAGLALRMLPAGSPAREFVADIEKSTEKVKNFSKQILSFTSKAAPKKEPVQLNEVVKDTAHFLMASISKTAALEYSQSDGLPPIMAEPQNMQQIVMNLIINASDAIGDNKGTIKVSTGKIYADREYLDSLRPAGLPEGNYVYVEVSDTGCGMSVETRRRVFEPFFTTKFTGRGIGLSAVFGIASAHGGAVGLESEEGCGATFRILLPVPAKAVEVAATKPDAEDVWNGKGSILLVDDEKDSLHMAKLVLEGAGYSVLTAGDGAEAIKIYRKNSDTISAVIMDLVMPHVRGDAAVKEMRAIKEDVNVLLLSGYHEIDLTEIKNGPGKTAILEKPYKINKLLGVVQDILKA